MRETAGLLAGFFLGFQSLACASEIRDVKPPEDFPANLTWLYVTCAVLAAVAIAIGYYLARSHRRSLNVPLPPVNPADAALERLEGLYRRNYPAQGKWKELYTDLADILRSYIEERFAIRAPEMTTEEFLDSAQNSAQLKDKDKKLLQQFLTSCDMVKFARHTPGHNHAEESFHSLRSFIEETRALALTGSGAES